MYFYLEFLKYILNLHFKEIKIERMQSSRQQ